MKNIIPRHFSVLSSAMAVVFLAKTHGVGTVQGGLVAFIGIIELDVLGIAATLMSCHVSSIS